MTRVKWIARIAVIGSLLFGGASAAQLPRIEWQLDASAVGDGTRSYGNQYDDAPFVISDPGLNSAWSVPTPDGVYLIIPTNTAGGSDYLRFLVTPFLAGTRGFQVVKLGAQGQLLWQRFLPTGLSNAPQSPGFASFGSVDATQTRRTADGGLALLANGEYLVLDANGALTLRLSDFCDRYIDFSIGTLELNQEGILIASTAESAAGSQSRACAIDRNGNEIERVLTPGNALFVADYRRDLGFLLKHGTISLGVWSDAQLQLRSGSIVRWTKAGATANNFFASFGPAISPAGDVWTYLDGMFTRLDATGTSAWQLDEALVTNAKVQDWLSDGSALMSTSEQVWRVIGSNGVQRWQQDLGAAQYAAFHIGDSQLSVTQWGVGTSVFRHHSVDLQTGVPQAHDRPSDVESPLLTLAPLGLAAMVDVRFATPTLTRRYEGSCSIPWYSGYCTRQLNFAQVEVRTRQASSGPVSLLPPAQLGFPLPSYAFETRPFPSLSSSDTSGEERLDRVYSKQYIHDGVRSLVQIQRLSPGGGVLWSRSFSANYDLGKAVFRDLGNWLFVTAQELPPEEQPGVGKLWAVDPESGDILWAIDLSSAWQRIESFSTSTLSRICGLTQSQPHHLQCVNRDTGAILQNEWVQGLPANTRLLASGRTSSAIRARLMPIDDTAPTGFNYFDVALNGSLGNGVDSQFSVSAGELAHADARWLASSFEGGFFATAAVSVPPSGRRTALLLARFDTSGNRVWQARINRAMRGFLAQGDTTSVAEMANGDVYIALHPSTTPATYKTELCKFNASGVFQACWEAPINGRISSLSPDGEDLRVWINDTVVDAVIDGVSLYSFRENAFSARQLQIPGFASVINNSVIDYLGAHYVALGARRSLATQTNGSYKLVAVRHTLQDFMFADGLEQ